MISAETVTNYTLFWICLVEGLIGFGIIFIDIIRNKVNLKKSEKE